MLVDEAKITVSLTHPNIAQIFELGLEGAVYTDLDDEGAAAFSLRLSSNPKRFYYVGLGDRRYR